jgi:hypothetical protein
LRWYWGTLMVTSAFALLYLGFVFVSRHPSALAPKARPDPEWARRQAEFDRVYGGSDLKIIQFYSVAAEVPAGAPATICYGVLNAKSVRIEPPVDGVGVSINRCVQVVPRKDTKYTLFATGSDGAVLSQSIVVRTHPRSSAQRRKASP